MTGPIVCAAPWCENDITDLVAAAKTKKPKRCQDPDCRKRWATERKNKSRSIGPKPKLMAERQKAERECAKLGHRGWLKTPRKWILVPISGKGRCDVCGKTVAQPRLTREANGGTLAWDAHRQRPKHLSELKARTGSLRDEDWWEETRWVKVMRPDPVTGEVIEEGVEVACFGAGIEITAPEKPATECASDIIELELVEEFEKAA